MTDHDLELRLRAWYRAEINELETAPSELRTDVQTITQAPARSRRMLTTTRRSVPMNRIAPFALASAAAVVSIVIAMSTMFRSPDVGHSQVPAATQGGETYTPTLPNPTAHAAGWTNAGRMSVPRVGHTATLLADGKVLVAGGNDGTGQLASAELYDPVSGTWTPTEDLIDSHSFHTATLLPDGRVLVAGGAVKLGQPAEIYDPVSGTWSPAGQLHHPYRGGHTATLLADGRVLVTGSGSAELYDPARGTWRVTGDMVEQRSFSAATLLSDGTVLVAGGGCCAQDRSLDSAELFDPDSGTWRATGSMSGGRAYLTATRLLDGSVLVAGGGSIGRVGMSPIDSSELFDPANGTWTTSGNMHAARVLFQTATLLLDGTVLAAGGASDPEWRTSAEVYDPTSRTWTVTVKMAQARSGHTATVLPDGTVLVAGGYNWTEGPTTEAVLASAELYSPASGS